MAISINNVQTSLTKTLSYTPSSVSNSILVVCVASEDLSNNDTITAVDFGGTALTQASFSSSFLSPHSNDSEIWYLLSPSTSTLTITVTGGESGRTGLVAMTLGGVAQTSPIDAFDNQATGTISPPYSITTSATTANDGSLVVSCLSGAIGLAALGLTGGTIQADIKPGGTLDLGVGTSTQATAGTYSHTWTEPSVFGAQRFSVTSAAFKEAAGGPSTDALLADDLQSLSTVSTPAITQTHVLLADNLQSLSTLSTPALTSGSTTDVLLADDLQSLSTVSTPGLGQAHILLADNLQSLSTVSTPAIAQIHSITADDLSSTSTLSTPAIGQIHVLLADDLQSLSRLSTPTINRPSIATPAIRTLTVGAESRILAQSAESRLSTIAAESRTTTL